MSAPHVMILASAGSGKTYALTDRFVSLLAAGAAPDRIVALTFTRKAAGEFFEEILGKLARAAAEPAFAAALAKRVGRPALGAADFLRLLRDMVDAMPRLRLGTLDGFFARIVRAFPQELGLAGDFEVLQEHSAQVQRRRVLQRLFARAPGGLDEAQRAFIEAFKRATFGLEEKGLASRLDHFLSSHAETFLAAPDARLWGDPVRIWPDGCDWLQPPRESRAAAAQALAGRLDLLGLNDGQRERFQLFLDQLPHVSPGVPWPAGVDYLVKNLLKEWPALRRGAADVVVERRRVSLGPDECGHLVAVIRHLIGAELRRSLEVTQGICSVLRGYDAVYHDSVRRAGRLTFADIQRMLQPDAGAPLLATGDEAVDGRLLIDFRLDGKFDHWLLDEFQDTSFGQWSVLRNLIDEVVQDPSGSRTFFCVGDIKQAIYTWRGGDPGLFREILRHYTEACPGSVAEEHLVTSWRSAPPVIGLVNAIFGRTAPIAELFPGPASAAWNAEWRDHESALPTVTGQAAWLHAPDEEARWELTVSLLRELDPIGRGLDCAVLVRTNGNAAALADHIRRTTGLPALAETDLPVATDNPVGAVLLALVQAAAHPGDVLAREHVAMSPLGPILNAAGLGDPAALTAALLGEIHRDGFEAALGPWVRRLESTLATDDAFSRLRSRQFLAAAARFDETGSRTVAEFVAFMQRHRVAEARTGGVIRVMTIHKSKGLGFDLVIVPDLEGSRLDQRRDGLAVRRRPDRAVDWLLDLPSKLFAERDEVLLEQVRAEEAEACQEALALLYVAVTRARQGLYVITSGPGKSESRNYPKLLSVTLGREPVVCRVGGLELTGGWTAGEPRWVEAPRTRREPPVEPDHPVSVLAGPGVARVPRRPAHRPSEGLSAQLDASLLFSPEGGEGAAFGSEMHAVLSRIEWLEPATSLVDSGAAPAVREAETCLAAPALRHVWARPSGGEVWRERAFEVVLDGAWVTGVFDRVVVSRGPDGRAIALTVFDFKTERVGDQADLAVAAARHRPQVELYRQVASRLAGVPLERASAEIVFTHPCVAVRIDQP